MDPGLGRLLDVVNGTITQAKHIAHLRAQRRITRPSA
jgi:hypothetical protein